ncbi:methyltransferase domain-containing protein [Halosimplex halophilum]|uniref:methyltransferase domain-containing protein n=1 Tax=Halosimplex halophilum TaxID=2559572 RepID=UPI00107F3583|nr:methyltransferase domain-containing protein [Halosimplex halophilum]
MGTDAINQTLGLAQKLNIFGDESWQERLVSPLFDTETRTEIKLELLFEGIDFTDQTVLDVGAGNGIYSLFAVCAGADRIVALEPAGDGSNGINVNGVRTVAESVETIEVVSEPLQNFKSNEQFDIVIMRNVINHLDEDATRDLLTDPTAHQRYQDIFGHLGDLTADDATIVITDSSRNNYLRFLGERNPFIGSRDWPIHQAPEVWATLLSHQGFAVRDIRWRSTLSLLGPVGKRLFSNRLVSHLTSSNFILIMDRMRSDDRMIGESSPDE